MKGQLNLTLGCMFSGKTSRLISMYKRYTIGGKKCALIKYKNDTRYDDNKVVTHDHIKENAFVCSYLHQIDEIIKEYDVLCIDEVQFYKDAYIIIDKWVQEGKIVEASGLNGTFNRTPFLIISRLIPLADNINFLKAVCRETGEDAIYSKLNIETDGSTVEIIGGTDKYSAVDRETFFSNKNFYNKDILREFMSIYSESLDHPLNSELAENLIQEVIDEKISFKKMMDNYKLLTFSRVEVS